MNLTSLDLMVLGIPLLVVFVVALMMRRYMRSVVDFLAAGRCAGRYLMCTATGELGTGVMVIVTGMEVFSRTGFSLSPWDSFLSFAFIGLTLFGFVTLRFRETRVLTFHQFFEVRYSKGLRVFASTLSFLTGLFSFGLAPAVGARFFIYFCGLPNHLTVFGMTFPTFSVLLVIFLGVSLYFTLTGGQISVLVTNCLEGLISGVFYILVSVFIILSVSRQHMAEALLSGPPGQSYVDPFDIGDRPDFNGWYLLLRLMMVIYTWRGAAWNQGFAASAKSAHESRMAGVLSVWREMGAQAMLALIAVGALTLLHHLDYAAKAAMVEQSVVNLETSQLATQMRMPTALGLLLAPGFKGMFCAIALFGLLSSQGVGMHSLGCTFLQDVILPLRRKPFDPQQHIRLLRASVIGVAIFATIFAIVYKPADYLILVTMLIGATYMGGVGSVTLGGLYWKKGTTAGAWVAMGIGALFSSLFWTGQTYWTQLVPPVAAWLGSGPIADFLRSHAGRCPFNGQILAFISMVAACASYVVVSLLTCRGDFDMDRMLHRGRYREETPAGEREIPRKRFSLGRLIGIDEHFTRGDRILQRSVFLWGLFWNATILGILLWNMFVSRWTAQAWFNWYYFYAICVTLAMGCITTVWFTIGTVRDLVRLFRDLRSEKSNAADNGTVKDHLSLGDPATRAAPKP